MRTSANVPCSTMTSMTFSIPSPCLPARVHLQSSHLGPVPRIRLHKTKEKKTPRQIERAHFGSILQVLVSENDKAYEAFRKVHEAFVAEAKGGSVQSPGTSATGSETTGTGATAPETGRYRCLRDMDWALTHAIFVSHRSFSSRCCICREPC